MLQDTLGVPQRQTGLDLLPELGDQEPQPQPQPQPQQQTVELEGPLDWSEDDFVVLRQMIGAYRETQIAGQFLQNHQYDYLPNEQNWHFIQQELQENNLTFTIENLETVFSHLQNLGLMEKPGDPPKVQPSKAKPFSTGLSSANTHDAPPPAAPETEDAFAARIASLPLDQARVVMQNAMRERRIAEERSRTLRGL